MPIYEYQCTQCHDRMEVIQNISDPPQSVCAKCGGAMKKLMSAPAIQFKGSGFYKTDYASSSSSKPETKTSSGSESKSESSSDTKSDTKSESKPETKSESKAESKSSD
jgi:putative FmdB family regulatory protein